MDSATKRKAVRVLKQVMRNRLAQTFFNKPVDPEALGIPDYPHIIKEPMDLGTILEKLGNDDYTSHVETLRDVQLVWDNCQKFNQPGSDVFNASVQLSNTFSKEWKKSKLPPQPAQVQPHASVSRSQQKSGRGQAVRGRSRTHANPPPTVATEDADAQNITFTVKSSGVGGGGGGSKAGRGRSSQRRSVRVGGVKRSATGPPQEEAVTYTTTRRTQRVNYDEDSGGGESSGEMLAPRKISDMHARGGEAGVRVDQGDRADGFKVRLGAGKLNEPEEQLASLLKQSHPLHRCLIVLEHIMQSEDALLLAQAPRPETCITLEKVSEYLLPGLDKGWGMVKYKSTKDVLRDVAFALKSILVANKNHRRFSQTCNRIFAEVRKWWQLGGLQQDLSQLRASVGGGVGAGGVPMMNQAGLGSPGGMRADVGVSEEAASLVPVQSRGGPSQRSTKMRKVKEVGGGETPKEEGNVSDPVLDANIAAIVEEVENARRELGQIQTRRAKEGKKLVDGYKAKQAKLVDLNKLLTTAGKQKEKVAGAVEVAKNAARSLQEAREILEMVICRQAEKVAAKEAEEKLEVHPENARIICEDVYEEHLQKPRPVPQELQKLGEFWLGSDFGPACAQVGSKRKTGVVE
ncbi:hypothetical protein BSKO_07242 [Bryopsis sp. KO-2023]|nr:hypothetical protein BSKO_07242 [Bryopsis sp. KO-2023]